MHWLDQAGWLNQPYLVVSVAGDGESGDPDAHYRCLLCSSSSAASACDGTRDGECDFARMSIGALVQHLIGSVHQTNVCLKLQESLPALRDESCFDTLSLPFCRLLDDRNPRQGSRFEFSCLTCRTKGMPLGVFVAHCQSARHLKKHASVCLGLGVVASVKEQMGHPTVKANATTPESALSTNHSSAATSVPPPLTLEAALVHHPYLARSERRRDVFAWECLLCHQSGLETDNDILRHVHSKEHESRHQELVASSNDDLSMERWTLSSGREEYRCRHCDTKTMTVERLPSHFNGAKHRQAIRNWLLAATGMSKDESRSLTIATALSVTSNEVMSDVPSSSSRSDGDGDDDNMGRLAKQALSVMDDVTAPTLLEESTDATTANSVGPLVSSIDSSSRPLLFSPTSSRSDVLRTLAKVEKCREIQHQISRLPETHKHHINHLLLQHVLCCDEPTQGVLLSLAMVYVNDYTLQQNQFSNCASSSSTGTADRSIIFDTSSGADAMSNFRKHLPQDSYLSPTVVRSTVELPFNGSTSSETAIASVGMALDPPLVASSVDLPYNSATAPPIQRDITASSGLVVPPRSETAHEEDSHSSPLPLVLVDTAAKRRRRKTRSHQECDWCSIL